MTELSSLFKFIVHVSQGLCLLTLSWRTSIYTLLMPAVQTSSSSGKNYNHLYVQLGSVTSLPSVREGVWSNTTERYE